MISLVEPAAFQVNAIGRMPALSVSVHASVLLAVSITLIVLAGIAGLFFAWRFSYFSPGDVEPLLTFFAWMILLLGGVGRVWAVPVGAVVFGFIFAGTRFLNFPPFTWVASDERAYIRLIIIGLIIIGLVVFRPQGLFGNRREMVLE